MKKILKRLVEKRVAPGSGPQQQIPPTTYQTMMTQRSPMGVDDFEQEQGQLYEGFVRGVVTEISDTPSGVNNTFWVDLLGARGVTYSVALPRGVASQVREGETWSVAGKVSRGPKKYSVVTNVESIQREPDRKVIFVYKYPWE